MKFSVYVGGSKFNIILVKLEEDNEQIFTVWQFDLPLPHPITSLNSILHPETEQDLPFWHPSAENAVFFAQEYGTISKTEELEFTLSARGNVSAFKLAPGAFVMEKGSDGGPSMRHCYWYDEEDYRQLDEKLIL